MRLASILSIRSLGSIDLARTSRAARRISNVTFLFVILAMSTISRWALADASSFGCRNGPGGPPAPVPCTPCPEFIVGYCATKDAGAACGVESDGTCRDLESLRSTCPQLLSSDSGDKPTTADGGAALLYCLKQDYCFEDANGGSCRVGRNEPRRGWLAALPATLIFSGIFLLAVDRRRRRRRRH